MNFDNPIERLKFHSLYAGMPGGTCIVDVKDVEYAVSEIEHKDQIINLMALAILNYDDQLVINKYKDINDVKETFEEILKDNATDTNVATIKHYVIGKNLFVAGKQIEDEISYRENNGEIITSIEMNQNTQDYLKRNNIYGFKSHIIGDIPVIIDNRLLNSEVILNREVRNKATEYEPYKPKEE